MTRYAVWLRGINVGGRHRLPMATLRDGLTAHGYRDVVTYIQSGNVALTSERETDELQAALTREIGELAGFGVPVVAVPADELRAIAAANPWAGVAPKLCHVVFHPDVLPEATRAAVAALPLEGDDEVAVGERVVYLHTPGGLSATKTAARLDRVAPGGTARNLASVATLVELTAP